MYNRTVQDVAREKKTWRDRLDRDFWQRSYQITLKISPAAARRNWRNWRIWRILQLCPSTINRPSPRLAALSGCHYKLELIVNNMSTGSDPQLVYITSRTRVIIASSPPIPKSYEAYIYIYVHLMPDLQLGTSTLVRFDPGRKEGRTSKACNKLNRTRSQA